MLVWVAVRPEGCLAVLAKPKSEFPQVLPGQHQLDVIARATRICDEQKRVDRMRLNADQALFQALRARRTALAKAQSVPAYVILPDRSLLDMARRKPATAAEMTGIHGVGEAKLARYGEAFLEVIRGYRGG
jgi:ATP-dependent DNA helicase RecQ